MATSSRVRLPAVILIAAIVATLAAWTATAYAADEARGPNDPVTQPDPEPDPSPPITAPPPSAGANDLRRIEQATGDLGRAKRSGAATIASKGRRSAAVLGACQSSGPGWKRIRRVRHAPQRALYTAAARRLLADMRMLLADQQSRIAVWQPAFERFVDRLQEANVSTPLLRAAIAAQARRLAAYRDIAKIGASCATFNRLAKQVHEFPTKTAEQIVRADYRATPRARRIQLYISNQLRAIDRRHGISYGDADTLADAAEAMVDMGGNPGYAVGFQYALSLR